MSSNTSSNNSENTRTLPVTIFTFTDNEIFSDIPGLAPNSRPIVPRNVPYLELNPAVNFFLTPTLVVHKCEKIRLPDGQIRRMLPAGLAHALYYNLEVLRDYVRYSFTSEKYPAGIIHTVIPAELLHQLQLPHPPVLLHSHENPLLRSYSEAEIVGVVHQFQLTVTEFSRWIEEARERSITTHKGTDWDFLCTAGWDGYSAHEKLVKLEGDIQRRLNRDTILETVIEAQHRPQLVRRALEEKERIKKKLEARQSHPGLYLDVDESGNGVIRPYGRTTEITFLSPADSSSSSSQSSLSSSDNPLAANINPASGPSPRRSPRLSQKGKSNRGRGRAGPASSQRRANDTQASDVKDKTVEENLGTAKKPAEFVASSDRDRHD